MILSLDFPGLIWVLEIAAQVSTENALYAQGPWNMEDYSNENDGCQ